MSRQGLAKSSPRKLLGVVLLVVGALLMAACVIPILRWLALSAVINPSGCRMRVYVKVVDQKGDKVPGYNLNIWGWESQVFAFGGPREMRTWCKSGPEGLLYYDSKKRITRAFFGGTLFSEGAKNPDYLASIDNASLSCADLAGTGEQSKKPKWGGLGLDTEHPLVVTVYKHGPPQKLLRCEMRDYNINPNGKYLSIDVLKGAKWISQRPEGDLAFRVVYAEEYRKLVPDERSATNGLEIVAALDGGVQAVSDGYAVTPPEDGYRQRLLYPRDRKINIQRNGTEFYFFCRGRRCYGYINYFFPPFMFYVVNLDGQRNLYYEGYPNTDPYQMKDYIIPPVLPQDAGAH